MSNANPFAYEPRRILAEPLIVSQGYHIKPYRIAHPDATDARSDLAATLATVLEPTDDPRMHGLGFCIEHVARDGIYFLLGRWYDGNNLHSQSYRVERVADRPSLNRLTLFACIWEMGIYAFERNAWISTMMTGGRGIAGTDDYLRCRFEGFV